MTTNCTGGKIIELRINGAPVCCLNTDKAVSADYLSFMSSVLRALAIDKNTLESEANAAGKTTDHGYSAFSTITIPTDL